QLETWKIAKIMDCWRLKWSKRLLGWVSRTKEPCITCERPTCKRKGKKLREIGYDGKRTYFLNLIENNSYVHIDYIFEEKEKK
ncbi:unnamed protein product, partial [marine sediment metagenome]